MSAARNAKILAGLMGAAVVAWGTRTLRLSAFNVAHGAGKYEDLYYLPPADWAPLMSLGFHAALADLMWCKSLVYFGEGATQGGELKHVFDYTDAIITLDPSFRAAYRWVATAAVFHGGDVAVSEGLRAAEYLERAIERWPTDGELRWDLGSLLRFDIAPLIKDDPTTKDAVIERAAPQIAAAARLGAGPPWLVLNNATYFERVGRSEQAVRHLEEAYATIDDEGVRAQILARLHKLRGQAYFDVMRSAEDAFERARRERFPYLSADAFLLIQASSARAYDEDVRAHFLAPARYVDDPDEADQSDAEGSPTP